VRPNCFRTAVETRVWDLNSKDVWEIVPDEHSQVDFKVSQGSSFSFQDKLLALLGSKPNDKIKLAVKPDEKGNTIITIVGVQLKVNRMPDEQSDPIKPMDIDHW